MPDQLENIIAPPPPPESETPDDGDSDDADRISELEFQVAELAGELDDIKASLKEKNEEDDPLATQYARKLDEIEQGLAAQKAMEAGNRVPFRERVFFAREDANGGWNETYPSGTNISNAAAPFRIGSGTNDTLLDNKDTVLVLEYRQLDRMQYVKLDAGVLPVLVEKTGGSNGTGTATASWTYTVRSIAGVTLGTSVPQTRPRPLGTMTYQSGTNGYGLAFYAPTLKLYDAGEVPGTGACP